MSDFSTNLKKAREAAGIERKDIAASLHMTTLSYGKYERGEREPKIDTLIQLAKILHTSIDALVGYEQNKLSRQDYLFQQAREFLSRYGLSISHIRFGDDEGDRFFVLDKSEKNCPTTFTGKQELIAFQQFADKRIFSSTLSFASTILRVMLDIYRISYMIDYIADDNKAPSDIRAFLQLVKKISPIDSVGKWELVIEKFMLVDQKNLTAVADMVDQKRAASASDDSASASGRGGAREADDDASGGSTENSAAPQTSKRTTGAKKKPRSRKSKAEKDV